MNYAFSKYALFLSLLAMLLPISAAARSDNQRKVNLSTAVEVGSTQLQPGTYRVEWQGNGPAVKVEFIKLPAFSLKVNILGP